MVFEQASSTAPWTLPAHVSLFTSLMPFDHHVQWSRESIRPQHAMLAERFRDAGYRTAAFTGGGYVASAFGFGQGFEIYEDHDEIIEEGPEPIASAALDWVRSHGGQPFFLFVHTYEPHSPFVHRDFVDPAEAGRLKGGVANEEVEAIHQGELVLTEAERRFVTDLYDGDVAHADRVIGGLLATLRDEGLLDGAILVILSDHGEDLWDHSEIRSPGHGHSLYEELVRIPLVVRAPGLVPAGARIATPVSLLDIAPTLLEMAGLASDPRHAGRSLAATWRTGAEPESRIVQAESVEYGPDRFAVRLGELKVILTPRPDAAHHGVRLKVEPLEIFDLGDDPGELENLSGQRGEEAADLVARARDRAARKMVFAGIEGPGDEKMSDELRQQLRALGYLD
jgi:arylsulfatase A-like enzyme